MSLDKKRQKSSQDVSSDSINDSERDNEPDMKQMLAVLANDLKDSIREVRDEVRDEMVALKETIAGLRNENERLRQTVQLSHDKEKAREEEAGRLRQTVSQQSNEITQLRQYIRSNNLKIYGLPEGGEGDGEGETEVETAQKVIELCKEKLKLDITEQDIDIAHRLGKKNQDGKPRSIIVRFVRRIVRNKVIALRKHLKKTGIVIADDLCPENARMFHELRGVVGRDVWSTGGKILLKAGGSVTRVTEENFAGIMRVLDGETDGDIEEMQQEERGEVGGMAIAPTDREQGRTKRDSRPIRSQPWFQPWSQPWHHFPNMRGFGRGRPQGRGRGRGQRGQRGWNGPKVGGLRCAWDKRGSDFMINPEDY